MDKIVFSRQTRHILKHVGLLYSVVSQSQTTSMSPGLTEVSLVTVGATYWMGSLKEPG